MIPAGISDIPDINDISNILPVLSDSVLSAVRQHDLLFINKLSFTQHSTVKTTEEADDVEVISDAIAKGAKALEKEGSIRIRLAIGVFQYASLDASSYAVSASTAANAGQTLSQNMEITPTFRCPISKSISANTLNTLMDFLFKRIKKEGGN